MKNLGIKILCFLISLIFFSCNRDDPVGGDFIDERAGDVVYDTLRFARRGSFREPSITGRSDFLYAGNEPDFKSIALLSYERPLTKTIYDSVVFLFPVESKGTESVYLKHFQGEFLEDSLVGWGDIELGPFLLASSIWIEDTLDTVLSFSIKKPLLADTIINVALYSDREIGVFYSRNSETPPVLHLFRGPLLEIVEPINDAFVDTILQHPAEIFIAGGSYTYKDTIFFDEIDFGKASRVNNAVLHLPVVSSSGPDPEIVVRYRDALSRPYRIEADTDTLKIEVTRFIDEWITEEDRYLVLEGRKGRLFTATFSKDIILEVIYTEKPGER